MTQMELVLALEFSKCTADIRIAQYELGARAPKAQLLHQIASVLKVDPIILTVDIPETEEEWKVVEYWMECYSLSYHKIEPGQN